MGKVKTYRLGIAPLKQSPRRVFVYLPDGYEKSSETYPVLYMFDGHNLFSDETATYGKCWGIKDYLDRNHIPLFVIGAECNHEGDSRLFEYCPGEIETGCWFPEGKLLGEVTAKWYTEKLKPWAEQKFRIHTDRAHVGIAGSSMGGLMSMYCIARYNHLYSKAGCVSSTMDITLPSLLETIHASTMSRDTRIYMDFGSSEERSKKKFAQMAERMMQINHAYQEMHCNTYPNIVVGGTHSEASWETIVPVFIEYLYPELFGKKGVNHD